MQKSDVTRLFDFPYYQLKKYPQEKCFVYKEQNQWKNMSTQEYITKANQISRALLNLGLQPNDKIAVITNSNHPKWHILDVAALQIGVVNVPLYPTFSEKDYAYILNHSDSKFCFVSDNELLEKVQKVIDKTTIERVFTFEEINTNYDWNSLLELGKDTSNQQQVESLKANVKPNDLATIIYTSGTTGTPKGVMLSHKNIVSSVFSVGSRVDLHDKNHRIISYLPICHIFERACSYYGQQMGFETHFAESIEALSDNLQEIKPHFMAVVPRLLEKVFDKIVDKGSDLSAIKKRLFFWALELAEHYKPYKQNGSWYEFKLSIANKLIFSKWREAFGGELNFMLSGSAPMQPRLVRIFTAAGISVFEGYGMTETSPGISVTDMRNKGFKIGTVGRILNDVDVKIAEDGEILAKGPNIMLGYYKNKELTERTIVNDYIHTGDIGEIDEDGFLKITDRKKEIFKTSGGKYIAPAVLEAELKKSRFIEQAMIIGENQKMPSALIQLHFDFIYDWAKRKGHTIDDITSDERLIKRIQKEIDFYNKKFGKWEQIKRFEITPEEWTVDNGLLTPTLKIKRKSILEKYEYLYDKIYKQLKIKH